MILITKLTVFFWTYVTLAAGSSSYQPMNLTDDLYQRILSTRDIFFDPLSKRPVPPINQLASFPMKIRDSKNVYGSLPCSCLSNLCNCCVDIKIEPLNSEDTGCVMISPGLDSLSLDTAILLNNKTVAEGRLSFDDPSPLCSPFPRLPLIAGCVKFNRIRTDKGHLRGCAKLEVRVTGTDAILWDMQFSCFKIGTDGIIFSNPNKNKEKPKPVKESIKEPVNKPMKKPNGECH